MIEAPNRHFVQFGSERIDFHLVFDQHERFRVTVHPDMRVIVNAPHGKSLVQVFSKIKSKAPWITRQIRYFEQFLPRMPERRYVSGETIHHLGRQYRLKLASGAEGAPKLSGRYLFVRTTSLDRPVVKSLVHDWYKQRARVVFERRLQRCIELTRRYGLETTELRIRLMKGRWGSCGTSGAILLNTEFVKAPVHCIDYVIVHELCHLRYQKHGDQFYQFLGKIMPDWQHRKSRLERVALDR